MSDYISERFDEMNKELHLAEKVKGLATYAQFREIAVEHVIKPRNVISLDFQDVKTLCKSGDVLDALSFDVTEVRADCIHSAIRQLRQAHEGKTLSVLLCNMAICNLVEIPQWAELLQGVLEEMASNNIEMMFGLYFPEELAPKGVIIGDTYKNLCGGLAFSRIFL